ncbi:hypothetical protein GTZ97_15940 [Aquabacterium fontiphilum]|jgi:hypothetical protein|uniref:hypothetical protein n=1 Tax=Aquabacterium fontiphilum TaxID=450365 RepID=UPI0013772C08|nr:hypothetical protein [Aquabacterium fontiphilum]NBD22151.1 hypothetical protein [Aquabacterium fontiphilum]
MAEIQRLQRDIALVVEDLHAANYRVEQGWLATRQRCKEAVWPWGAVAVGAGVLAWWWWQRGEGARPLRAQAAAVTASAVAPLREHWRALALGALPLVMQYGVLPMLPPRWRTWAAHPVAIALVGKWLQQR